MQTEGPVKNILLYVDGTEECITAAQYAIALAKTMDAKLKALYVVNISLLQELVKAKIFIKIEEMDYEQDLEQDGKRYLNYISEMANAKNVEVKTELIKGVVNKEVVRQAGDMNADLLIMGELPPMLSRTDTFHDEAELIFRKAPCPVLVVKGPDKIEKMFSAI